MTFFIISPQSTTNHNQCRHYGLQLLILSINLNIIIAIVITYTSTTTSNTMTIVKKTQYHTIVLLNEF